MRRRVTYCGMQKQGKLDAEEVGGWVNDWVDGCMDEQETDEQMGVWMCG